MPGEEMPQLRWHVDVEDGSRTHGIINSDETEDDKIRVESLKPSHVGVYCDRAIRGLRFAIRGLRFALVGFRFALLGLRYNF